MSTASTRSPLVAALVLAAIVLTVVAASPSLGAGHGVLEVRTTPAVASQIVVDGVPRNQTELGGLRLLAGEHRVCYSAVDGYLTPACDDVDVVEGETTVVSASFTRSGWLHVTTEPVVAPVIIDSVVRDAGEVLLPVAVGSHEVCFAPAAGYETPACSTVTVEPDETVTVLGDYVEPTEPPAPGEPAPEQPEPDDPPAEVATIMPTLTGSATRGGGNQPWSATATVTIHDRAGTPIAGVAVSGGWQTGQPASSMVASCVTGANGACQVHAYDMATGAGNTATYTVSQLQREGYLDASQLGARSISINRNGTVATF